jgi:hypothetical protein
MFTNQNGHIEIYTNNTSQHILLQPGGGNVGIGMANPANLLTIGPAVNPGANSLGTTNLVVYGNICCPRNRFIFSNGGTALNDYNHCFYNNFLNLDNEGSFDGMKFNVYAGAWFRVGSAALGIVPTTGLFIDSTGKVGVGTTGPSTTLDVNGSLNVSGAISGTMLSQYKYSFNTSSSTMNLTTSFGINVAGGNNSRFFLVSITNDWGGSAQSNGSLFFLFIPNNNTGASSYSPLVTSSLLNGATGTYSLSVTAYNTITISTGQWTNGVTTTVVLTRLSI